MDRPGLSILVALALLATGCSKGEPTVPYEKIDLTVKTKATNGPNAFDRYTSLATRAQRTSTLSLDARSTQGNRKRDLREMRPILDDLSSGTLRQCSFKYVAMAPFERAPYREGWLKIGRSMVWQIEELVGQGKVLEASRWVVVATVFGLDLSGGTMSDASLGYQIANDARGALAGEMYRLSVGELTELGNGIQRALDRMPDDEMTISHEGVQILAAIKLIQDAHKDGTLVDLAHQFYGNSRSAIKTIANFDMDQRQEFFRSLIVEQKHVVGQLVEMCKSAGSHRGALEAGLSGEEKVIAENFFYNGNAWMAKRDSTVARTRMFALTARILAQAKASGKAPDTLDGFQKPLAVDPYTALTLGYIALGKDFVLYSYGEDGKDDRGDTDSKRTWPDLRLEEAPL